MKNYIIALLSILLIALSIFAYNNIAKAADILKTSDNTIIWLYDNPDYSVLDVSTVQTGGIIIGYYDPEKRHPIIQQGVLIKFNTMPDATQLENIDIEMSLRGLTREGGTTIKDRLEAIESEIASLQAVQSK